MTDDLRPTLLALRTNTIRLCLASWGVQRTTVVHFGYLRRLLLLLCCLARKAPSPDHPVYPVRPDQGVLRTFVRTDCVAVANRRTAPVWWPVVRSARR